MMAFPTARVLPREFDLFCTGTCGINDTAPTEHVNICVCVCVCACGYKVLLFDLANNNNIKWCVCVKGNYKSSADNAVVSIVTVQDHIWLCLHACMHAYLS